MWQVVRLPEYMGWIASFGPSAQHIIVAAAQSAGANAILESSAVLQVRATADIGLPVYFVRHLCVDRLSSTLPEQIIEVLYLPSIHAVGKENACTCALGVGKGFHFSVLTRPSVNRPFGPSKIDRDM